MGLGSVGLIQLGVLFLVFLPIYVLPSIIALARRHPKRWPIVIVNLVGGLFGGLGWVAAMVWCFIDQGHPKRDPVNELERLEGLMERGQISQEEFERMKQKILQTSRT